MKKISDAQAKAIHAETARREAAGKISKTKADEIHRSTERKRKETFDEYALRVIPEPKAAPKAPPRKAPITTPLRERAMKLAYEQLAREYAAQLRRAYANPDLDERRADVTRMNTFFGTPDSRRRASLARQIMKRQGF